MLLNKHKDFVLIGITVLGLVLTFGMAVIGTTLDFFQPGQVGTNQFSSYGIVDAEKVSNPSSNGMKSETITFGFGDKEDKKSPVNADPNGFAAVGFSLEEANKKEPSIFNVHAVGTVKSEAKVEFLFESLSPTDYESNTFEQAYSPFTRLANSKGFSNVKFLSTVSNDGERHVTIKAEVDNARLSSNASMDLWRQMLLVLSPISENTSYDLTMTLAEGITLHTTLSTEAEQKKMMEPDMNNNWESVVELRKMGVISNIDLFIQGGDKSDNTVAVTIGKSDTVVNDLDGVKAYAENRGNKFPRNYTTTITVEGDGSPSLVFYPER